MDLQICLALSLYEVRRKHGIELTLEGFLFYDLIWWKRGDLMQMVWNVMFVPALDVPMGVNGDGILDVAFYKVLPANRPASVTYLNISASINGVTNPQRLSNDTYGELTWLTAVPRKWSDKNYYYPIPQPDLVTNPKLGQNPGW